MFAIEMKNSAKNKTYGLSRAKLYKRVDSLWFIALLLLALVLLLPRLAGLDIISGKYLWAEDGNIFINEAQSIGFSSLWKPYAGYLHVYPRLVAIISSYFHLGIRPLILFSGWLVSYLFLIGILIQKTKLFGNTSLSLVFLVILVALQPNNGENFFNVTNSQWMLGVSLSLLAITCTRNSPFKISTLRVALLLLLSLTGPFSLILIPVLIIKNFLMKDFQKNRGVYLIILGSGLLQLLILLHSGRTASGPIDTQIWDWITSFIRIILFNTDTLFTKSCALLFYIVLMITIINKPGKMQKQFEAKAQVILLIMAATLFIFAAQYACKENPMGIAPLGRAMRYAWTPHTLIFFIAFSIVNTWRSQLILFILALIICYQQFHSVTFQNLQFKSFANFAKYINVIIPIHPQWPDFPGWHINGMPQKSVSPLQLTMSLNNVSAIGAKINRSKNKLRIISTSKSTPMILLNDTIICENASDLGLEFEMIRSNEGWVQVFWNNNGIFSEQESLRRWYPSGLIKAQFALPYEQGGINIRLVPLEKTAELIINEIKVYCLPK